jgi:peptidoglycan/xylan/chitin deacetylase (PgdA/CDA1 family)
MLCYHHIAPPRRGARLKWLYVSPQIFARQIAEFQSNGFSTSESLTFEASSEPGKVIANQPDGNPQRRVVLTFDDGFCDMFEHALPLLRQNRLRSIAFLVSDLLGKTNEWQQKMGDIVEPLMDVAQVRDWLAAGQQIGSHTKTHSRLTQLSLPDAREEITASKKSLEDRFSVRIDHFCYPFGDWNKAVRDLVSEAGYKTACTTVPGVNTAETPPFELNRYLAGYRARTLKTIWQRLRVHLGPITSAITRGVGHRPGQSNAGMQA